MTPTHDIPQLLSFALFFIGVGLSLKRAAEMHGYFRVRVVVFTSILTCMVFYLFLVYGFSFGNPPIEYDCDPTGQQFCLTDM